MKDFFIKTVKVEGLRKEHYQVGWMKPELDKDGNPCERYMGVSRAFYNRVRAEGFLAMMQRNERIYDERLERERDEFYIRKNRRKGGIW